MQHLISEQQFMLRQPYFPEKKPYDSFYLKLANKLADAASPELPGWPPQVIGRMALCITGYLQDILTDAGIWRGFIEQNNRLYGKYLPFYDIPDNYVPHELNHVDVRFLVWYALSMNYEEKRDLDPMAPEILRVSETLHSLIDNVYEDPETPVPVDYNLAKHLELNNMDDADQVFHFGNWLFMHCYLMTPAYALTLSEIMQNPELKKPDNLDLLRKTLEQSMMEDPTGPLALYLREWIYLIIENREITQKNPQPENKVIHPYYEKVTAFTGGAPVAFFASYKDLNDFFIKVLGWDDTDNLPQLKNNSDFAIMVEPSKGMLVAANVAKCIDLPYNPLYNKEYAKAHAFELLTVRGRCPGDLLRFVIANDALPDAHFPGSSDTKTVENNADFIARCYLQKYYRGD